MLTLIDLIITNELYRMSFYAVLGLILCYGATKLEKYYDAKYGNDSEENNQ